jgi:hypothetical protein
MSVMPITSIIPNMIFGIVLIIGWLPVIIMTEINNKGNLNELKILENEIKEKLKLSDVTFTFNPPRIGTNNYDFDEKSIKIDKEYLTNKNNNIYIKKTIRTIAGDITDKSKHWIEVTEGEIFIFNINVEGINMNNNDYKYLAMQNKVDTILNINDKFNTNITYDIEIYSIPINKFLKVEGLEADKIDMEVYTYEYGPQDAAKKSIINRKKSSNQLQMWVWRLGTFLMLFIGLSLIVSPLTALVQLGETLPFPLKILAIPGQIILNIYETLSFFGSLLLTILMTFLVWTIINMPKLSVLVGGLLVGLIMYFNKK